MSFVSSPVEFYCKVSSVVPPPGYQEKYTSDAVSGYEYIELTRPASDSGYLVDTSVKVLGDLLVSQEAIPIRMFVQPQTAIGVETKILGFLVSDIGYPVEVSVKVLRDLLASMDFASYRILIQPERATPTDIVSYLKMLARDFARSFEEAHGASQIDKDTYVSISTEAEGYIRTVNPKQKIYAIDIVGLRDALYSLGSYLIGIGFDIPSISVALKYLEDIKPSTFDILDARMMNAISYALYHMHKAILRKTQYIADIGSVSEVSTLWVGPPESEPEFPRLRLYNRSYGITVYCTKNPRTQYGKESGMPSNYVYTYWFEDRYDYDYNDAMVRIYWEPPNYRLDIYRGHAGDIHDWYYDDTLIVTTTETTLKPGEYVLHASVWVDTATKDLKGYRVY
jgi:hypothetical protein